ncbi:L-aspartate oxidase [Dichotomicrobium thermohalophilum]|uniref:L-aspartate oxidase n=1 Tax=Dichotomicrobium thermohalophilum TaxID=933063 RepID=A0A397Q0W2_9HYPH|nr:L-aspartate oxidase [Dichotomicrobium thermohalophilum]RIA55036.1 L-aspartate oxidase [Dichotomicrobium thermohalophilum]
MQTGDASDVVIVGAGLAGLFTALKLAPHPVTLISPQRLGDGASSAWAQGGIAAAVAEGDTPEAHAADTVRAGGGLVNTAMAESLAREAAARIQDLLALGVPLDRDGTGALAVSREAAHSADRIVHVKGDQAGQAVMQALVAAVRRTPSIRVIEAHVAEDLIKNGRRVTGVRVRSAEGSGGYVIPARAVVLASGGVGGLYATTTNPVLSRGDGLAIAARAGAIIGDAEFVQFHPTGIEVARDPAPLATEALRGEGAILVNGRSERFMPSIHPDAELAPRDVVARAVHREVVNGRGAYLDCRAAIGGRMAEDFPAVYGACKDAGLDPAHELVPVAPAAHYHMGGVWTDSMGRTSVDQLWACGEVACTGVHGANRLASNSLLEAVVMGARIARDIARFAPGWRSSPPPKVDSSPVSARVEPSAEAIAELRETMSRHVGMERSRDGLVAALHDLDSLDVGPEGALSNAIAAARLITVSALLRTESRGSHYRSDYPEPDDAWRRHSLLTLRQAEAIAAEVTGTASEPIRLSA